eukprot:2356771-Rhodomonas_salina.1
MSCGTLMMRSAVVATHTAWYSHSALSRSSYPHRVRETPRWTSGTTLSCGTRRVRSVVAATHNVCVGHTVGHKVAHKAVVPAPCSQP